MPGLLRRCSHAAQAMGNHRPGLLETVGVDQQQFHDDASARVRNPLSPQGCASAVFKRVYATPSERLGIEHPAGVPLADDAGTLFFQDEPVGPEIPERPVEATLGASGPPEGLRNRLSSWSGPPSCSATYSLTIASVMVPVVTAK